MGTEEENGVMKRKLEKEGGGQREKWRQGRLEWRWPEDTQFVVLKGHMAILSFSLDHSLDTSLISHTNKTRLAPDSWTQHEIYIFKNKIKIEKNHTTLLHRELDNVSLSNMMTVSGCVTYTRRALHSGSVYLALSKWTSFSVKINPLKTKFYNNRMTTS